MQNQYSAENKRKQLGVMIALIVIPFLLAALLWWILPSGYGQYAAGKQKITSHSNIWDPLQPAIKLGTQIFTP